MKSQAQKQQEAIARNIQSMRLNYLQMLEDEKLVKKGKVPENCHLTPEQFKAIITIRRHQMTNSDLVCMKVGVPKRDWQAFQMSEQFRSIFR